MKKELYIFIGLFLFLAIGMHFKEWMSHPIEHILALPNSVVYGIGFMHPIIFTFVIYSIFVLFRSVYRTIKRAIIK